jgi:RNA polymerase sigma-70 factor (ECF subfamily)
LLLNVRGIEKNVGTDLTQFQDAELINVALTGDREAYGVLVNRYMETLCGYALHLCGDYDTAADLAQETFITAYACLDRLKQPAAFSSWLLGILKNKYRNLGREQRIPTIPLDHLKEMGFEPPDSDNAPRYSDEELKQIISNVYSLPEKYRDVLLLRYLKGLSYKEIAEFLGLPVSTVTMRLTYARRLLLKKAKEGGLL